MREGLAVAGKTVLIAIGVFVLILGLLDLAVAPGEGRSPLRGALLLVGGLALAVPILGFAVRDVVREARRGRG